MFLFALLFGHALAAKASRTYAKHVIKRKKQLGHLEATTQ